MHLAKNPKIVRYIYPGLIWRIPVKEKLIFLTFDDGPDPLATIDALNLLDKFNAKATFFCVGEKAGLHPDILKKIKDKGHQIGNHSNKHLNGKKTSLETYVDDVMKADEILKSKLFRPPYGKITNKEISKLKTKFKIVMWSVLPGDFDIYQSKETVLNRCIRYTKKGDIVVLHDNPKFYDTMIYTLDGMLKHFTEKGFKFVALEEQYL